MTGRDGPNAKHAFPVPRVRVTKSIGEGKRRFELLIGRAEAQAGVSRPARACDYSAHPFRWRWLAVGLSRDGVGGLGRGCECGLARDLEGVNCRYGDVWLDA